MSESVVTEINQDTKMVTVDQVEMIKLADDAYDLSLENQAAAHEQDIVSEQPLTPEQEAANANEEAAKKFTELLPYVKKFGSAMSSNSVVRVLYAMAEFPLGASKPRLLNDPERQLFHILQELNGAKSIVISTILKQQAETEQLKQKATEGSVAEQEVTDGSTN